jgi:hypothetical protein
VVDRDGRYPFFRLVLYGVRVKRKEPKIESEVGSIYLNCNLPGDKKCDAQVGSLLLF